MLPLSYAVRNLMRSFSRTTQMIVGSTLVVILIMNALAFNSGINDSLSATGNDRNVILMAAGSEASAMRSQISSVVPDYVRTSIKGISTKLGVAGISPEIHHMGLLKKDKEDTASREILFRGVELSALLVHNKVSINEGEFPGPGEILVGRQAFRLLNLKENDLQVGNTVYIEERPFRVSGIFDSPGTVVDAEIWMPLNELKILTQRESLSCSVVSLDKADYTDIKLFCRQRLDLELTSVPETDFYRNLISFYTPIKTMIWIMSLLIAVGAVFGGLNTTYVAFISRRHELASLQAMGFSRTAILISMLQEAILTTLLGTVLAMIGCKFLLEGLTIPFATGVFSLQYSAGIFLYAMSVGIGLGIIGIVVPAWNCLKPPITMNLRS